MMRKVLNIAHRGARSLAPENTLAAVQKAWDIGTDGIEIDIAVSRDGQLFLHHDANLLRTTNVRECYPDRSDELHTSFSLAELQKLDAGSWYVKEDPFGQIAAGNVSFEEQQGFVGITIPTLEEVLLFVAAKEWMVNIEIKKVPTPMESFPVEQKVIEVIEKVNISKEKVLLSSFVHDYLHSLQRICPEIEVQALLGNTGEQKLNWGEYHFATYNANADLIDEDQISLALQNKSQVNLFTINTPREMKRFITAGVKGIITDFPQILHTLQC